MNALRDAAREFLAQRRVAVAGVSRDGTLPANYIYRRLRDAGYDVVPINPNADDVEDVRCYHSIGDVPGTLDGVVIATPPGATMSVVKQCVGARIPRVWMHRSMGVGSADDTAVRYAVQHGIAVIPDGCPMMFLDPVDGAHKCIRFITGFIRRDEKSAATAAYLDAIDASQSMSKIQVTSHAR